MDANDSLLKYGVDVTQIELTDSKREKNISMRISYPQEDGLFPLIVFSHGAGASQNEYLALTHHWAASGYVVIQPTHQDSLTLKNLVSNPLGIIGVLKKMQVNRSEWLERVGDLSFVIDHVVTIESMVAGLAGKINVNEIGVAGHSYGAFTTLLAAGAQLINCDSNQLESFADNRVKAFLVMSPPGTGQQDLSGHSFGALTKPLLAMTGSKDRGLNGEPPQWRCESFQLAKPGDKYLAFIEGAGHMSFAAGRATLTTEKIKQEPGQLQAIWPRLPDSDIKQKRIDQRVILTYIKNISTIFWNAYLKSDVEALEMLQSNELSEVTGGVVEFTKR